MASQPATLSIVSTRARATVVALCLACWAVLGLAAAPASAQNLVTNGTFQITGGTQSYDFGTIMESQGNGAPAAEATESLAGWSGAGIDQVWYAGTHNEDDYTYLPNDSQVDDDLEGPYYGSANGFTYASPSGGNYIAMTSGTNYGGAVTQTITGLDVGDPYSLSFSWAAAEIAGATTGSTQDIQVSLGSSTQTTASATIPNYGFSGWISVVETFVATSKTEVLSFLAQNTNNQGYQQMSLLSNVSLVETPEPASITALATGVAALFAVRRRRKGAGVGVPA